MKRFAYILIMLFLVNCGSTQLKETNASDVQPAPDGLKASSIEDKASIVAAEKTAEETKLVAPIPDFSNSKGIGEIMNFLASDELQGRDSGSEGIAKAADFIEAIFIKNNIKPYFENFRDTLSNFNEPAYNMVGMIEGNDPELKKEFIILGAHYDHIGRIESKNGDEIANGANDNASGTTTVLELARYFGNAKANKRSIIFALFSAEEKGLLGSQYFAKYPTIPKENIVGNINLDMPVLTYDFQDLIVFGGTRSSFNAAISKAAEEMGLVVSPDPMAEQGIFTRSDHFRFVEEGVPSVMLSTGFGNGGAKAWETHFAKHYHRPSDDMMNDINFDAAAKFAELKTRIAFTLANADRRPLWNKGDFFAEQFNGPMQE